MKHHTTEVAQGVEQSFETIADQFSHTRQHLWPELVTLVKNVQPGERVLDIGCGNGRLYPALKEQGAEYVGVDISDALLRKAQSQFPDGTFLKSDMVTLENVSGTFDRVFMIASLHHVPSRVLRLRTLQAAGKHLTAGGSLYITVWNLYQPRFLRARLRSLGRKLIGKHPLSVRDVFIPWKRPDGTVIVRRYYHAFTLRELTSLVEQAGFTVDDVWYTAQGSRTSARAGHNLCLTAVKQT